MAIQNVWDKAETVLLWKFLVTQTYLRRQKKKKKKSNINHQTLQLNQLEKEEQTKPQR